MIDFRKYSQPILDVLNKLGINARFEGRNDLTINGKKFSGNAEMVYKNKILHHADIQISSLEAFKNTGKSLRQRFYISLFIIRLLVLTLLIIALARPQSHSSKQDVSVTGIDIVLATDISGSMLAEDFKPNRLEAAKDVASDFIEGRPNDRIGLVVFSGESFTQCPLTSDHSVLINLFRDVKSGMIDDGTALGDGLATAVDRLRNSKAVSKVVILLTDGVNNMGSLDPMDSVNTALKEKNVKEEIIKQFIATLNDCEFARFAPGDSTGAMEGIYKEAMDVILKIERELK